MKIKKTKNELLYALTVYSYNRSNCTGHNEILSNITQINWGKLLSVDGGFTLVSNLGGVAALNTKFY